MIAASAVGRESFTAALLGDVACLDSDGRGRMPDIELRLAAQRFPPNDLRATLAQQLAMLQVADEVITDVGHLPVESTGIYVGMGTDPEAARFGARWRAASSEPPGDDRSARITRTRDAIGPVLTAAGVLGAMPNLVANRVNSQYDAAGPSFAVSAEEHSGIEALHIAARALRDGSLDAALVGAVDMSCDPVHTLAAELVLPDDRRRPGDAAVMVVLKRLADAERDGDTVYAVLPANGPVSGDIQLGLGDDRSDPPGEVLGGVLGEGRDDPVRNLTDLFGHAHAASGLIHVAAAALLLHHRVSVGDVPIVPSRSIAENDLGTGAGPRTASVTTNAFEGVVARAVLLAEATDHRAPAREARRADTPQLHVFSGAEVADVLSALDAGHESDVGPARLVIVATGAEQLALRTRRARLHLVDGNPPGAGVHVRSTPIVGDLAAVFTAGGAAYHGMGTELLRAIPELASGSPLGELAGWIHDRNHEPSAADFLWGTAVLSQAHARLTLDLLGLRPAAAIGYSSGETNSLFAFGVWSDLAAMRDEVAASGMLEREIAGSFDAVGRAWGVDRVDWAVWNVLAPVDDIRTAIADEPRVHLMLVNTDRDAVISGDVAACQRVVEVFGASRCRSVAYNLACHVPEVRAEFHRPWQRIHTRTVTPVDGVRFYSNGVGGAYRVSSDACAAAITAQAESTVDFPATIRSAYDDGVRVFVEHGPSGACTNYIREILDGHDVLAVHLDRRDHDIEQVVDVCAALVAAGVDVDHAALAARLEPAAVAPTAAHGPTMSFPAHRAPTRPPIPSPSSSTTSAAVAALPAWSASAPAQSTAVVDVRIEPPGVAQTMACAPALASVFDTSEVAATTPTPVAADVPDVPQTAVTGPVPAATGAIDVTIPTDESGVVDVVGASIEPAVEVTGPAAILLGQIGEITRLHQAFVAQQAAMHEMFLVARGTTLEMLAPTSHPDLADQPLVLVTAGPVAANDPPPDPDPDADADADATPDPVAPSPGPLWDRAQLEIHSSGRISELFGPMFAPQDRHTIQCRMPEPPLLLADRVSGIDAEPGVLGTGTIWTETDVVRDAWYLNGGYMPTGFMIEAGQADLMLISYMGIDLLVRGERSYRLLGCTLVYHGDLPTAGETLEYEIRITGHARHGDIRLFFFEYDCTVAGDPRLTVRDAQAGFFTADELRDAQGALWTPEAAAGDLSPDARVDPPVVACTKQSFDAAAVRAFSEGRAADCFGPGYEWTQTHTRTPTIQTGQQLFIDEVTHFDPSGGPWGRGFMRCESAVDDDAWYFDGHFKNDPCMPGNFMVEACVEAMSFYLAALGHTVRADGWRFQPLPEQPFELKCRGEINPRSERVAYELHVEEIWDSPHPTIICDVLGFVDDRAAFHAHRIGVELVPGWPLDTMPEIHEGVLEPRPAATDADGFPFDWKAMIACAWGAPTDAFGALYAGFDTTRRSPRLPGPPYHFISRIVDIDGDLGDCRAGMRIVCEYDVPDDAWYFDANGTETMPYAVLLEAALQPCGWVASAAGSVVDSEGDMLFRNLDGTGTMLGQLARTSGTLTTTVTLTGVSRAGGMIVEGFDVTCALGERPVFEMTTVFGFFPPAAFDDQAGLVVTDEHRAQTALIADAPGVAVDLTTRPDRFCAGTARLADDMLLMLDRVLRVRGAGAAGLGIVIGEKDVDVSEWFFRAHFFQDPVQPGSLGIEALLQLLQFFMLDTDLDDGLEDAQFEPIMTGVPLTWKYRGQVTPDNTMITTVMEITEVGTDEHGPFVIGNGSLWCDGLRIYEVTDMGMRLVQGEAPAGAGPGSQAQFSSRSESPSQLRSPAQRRSHQIVVDRDHHPQLADHAVNGTPTVPVVFVVEWFARLALDSAPDMRLAELSDVRVLSGLVAPGFDDGRELRLVASVADSQTSTDGRHSTLELIDVESGRLHYRATARLVADLAQVEHHEAPKVDDLGAGEPWPGAFYDLPDGTGALFHGPAFQVIDTIPLVTPAGMHATLHGIRTRSTGARHFRTTESTGARHSRTTESTGARQSRTTESTGARHSRTTHDADWPDEEWVTDAALLDGALQMAVLWTERQLGAASLPTSIGRVQLFGPPLDGAHTALLIGRRATAHMVECDVTIRSADGAIVARLDGVVTHRLAPHD